MSISRILSLMLASLLLLVGLSACNPPLDSGTTVRQGVGIRDYYTLRSDPEGTGDLVSRDMRPTPRPREAITSDDYFGLKLEHIYAGGMLGREVGNIALIAELGGVLPEGVSCDEVEEDELGIRISQQQRDNRRASTSCNYKTVLQINPVFRDAHATFDSVFITPPFRSGFEPLRLQFIMARLEDVELARQIMRWAEGAYQQLDQRGLIRAQNWQRELISIGFTAANYIIDYASQPTYVLEFTTEFVPVESVEGAVPQSLLMGGDFVIVARPNVDGFSPDGAHQARDDLFFDSGRLYWRESRREYRESPYLIFKVVRYSRFPTALPIQIPSLVRQLRVSDDPQSIAGPARELIAEFQEARALNETEGQLLNTLISWVADTTALSARLEAAAYESEPVPLALSELPVALAAGLLPLADLRAAVASTERLSGRIYGDYGQTPGLRQEECVTLRSLTQDLADAYKAQLPGVKTAFESLQIRRLQLQRRGDEASEAERSELAALTSAELALGAQIEALPDELDEPTCPGMRQAWTVPGQEE